MPESRRDIKSIRNNYVHEGKLILHKKDKKELSVSQIREYINLAKVILENIESEMPDEEKRIPIHSLRNLKMDVKI